MLVYFGYPQAHEDDAERSVRAGLELIQAVGGLKSNAPLQTRVGIATGLVIVGDLIGSGAAQEQTVVGETPNLAARHLELLAIMDIRARSISFTSRPRRPEGPPDREHAGETLPLPIAATIALEMIGPMPGTVMTLGWSPLFPSPFFLNKI